MSRNGRFQLGFFNPNGTDSWYSGIWSLPRKKIVWVVNREAPVINKMGVLRLSRDGYLRLFGKKGVFVWSPNVDKAASSAVLLDSGNFALLAANNKSETVWQSFDHPGNTWLPGMKFGREQKLVSWKNSLDPAPGIFSFQIDPYGDNQLVLLSNNTVTYWRIKWDDDRTSETPTFFNVKFSLENSSSGFYLTYMPTVDHFLGFALRTHGTFVVEYYYEHYMVDLEVPYSCEVYNLCHPFGGCVGGDDPCICSKGWNPRDRGAWDLHERRASACVPFDCGPLYGDTDGFISGYNIWVPATASDIYPALTREACEEACLRNCSCIAFSPEHCQFWSRDLFNTDNLSDTLVLRGTLQLRVANGCARSPSYKATDLGVVLVLTIGSIGALVTALLFITKAWHRRRRRLRSTQRCADSSDELLRTLTYKDLKTLTKNFRYKLGTGGFGSVFKGTLRDGTLVAVKKLEGSKQCEKQFRAEINSVGIIHHVNLVKLRGFCAEGSRRLLVYDYMPNGSLNSFLFTSNSKSQGKLLD